MEGEGGRGRKWVGDRGLLSSPPAVRSSNLPPRPSRAVLMGCIRVGPPTSPGPRAAVARARRPPTRPHSCRLPPANRARGSAPVLRLFGRDAGAAERTAHARLGALAHALCEHARRVGPAPPGPASPGPASPGPPRPAGKCGGEGEGGKGSEQGRKGEEGGAQGGGRREEGRKEGGLGKGGREQWIEGE